MKPLLRRAQADADVLNAIDYFNINAPEHTLKLIDQIESAYQHIQQFPTSGSPRYAHELDIPDLRIWPCKTFPYIIFYIEKTNQIEIWVVLHAKKDIPNSLQENS